MTDIGKMIITKIFPGAIKIKNKVYLIGGENGHKELKVTFWNFLYHYFNETLGYDYSIGDMKKFGLTNIHLIDGTWESRKHRPHLEVLRVDVNAQGLK